MKDFKILASKQIVDLVMQKLKDNNIESFYANSANEAKEIFLSLLSKGERVLISSSETLEAIGIKDSVDNHAEYVSVRKEYMALDHDTEASRIRELRSTPQVIGASAHAVTKNGELIIASNTGSQIAAIASGAGKVILVIGVQKIVDNLAEGMQRIHDYVLPLESDRLQKLYGVKSNVSKLLIINKESVNKRFTVIFVNQLLGY